jgi:hypothetical protein
MSANIIRLLPDEERALLECYVAGTKHPASFQQLFDTMEVPTDAVPDRLQIAVAQILLHHVQDSLPQWASITSDGTLVTNRQGINATRTHDCTSLRAFFSRSTGRQAAPDSNGRRLITRPMSLA